MEYLTINEVAELLRVHRNTVTKLCKEGLPYFSIGGKKRFVADTIKEWIIQQSCAKQEPVIEPVIEPAKQVVKPKTKKKVSPIKSDSSGDKTIDDANKAFEDWKRKHCTQKEKTDHGSL